MYEKNIISCRIDNSIVKNYVEAINTMKDPMSYIKRVLKRNVNTNLDTYVKTFKSINDKYNSINDMLIAINVISSNFPNDQKLIYTSIIKQIMDANNGMISTRMIEPLNISRHYLSILEKNHDIERVSRGQYVSSSAFEDSYFLFQQKYKKAIFSHMNALYFYGMTEEFPYVYTVTVPRRYHMNTINKKCNVFYASQDIYEMGVVEIKTPSGNKVRAYDKEKCICDIIKSKGRMDSEQVKKTIKYYIQSENKDMAKLSEYAKKMNISEKVMNMVSIYYE